ETLVELDIEYRHLAEQHGAPAYIRVATAQTHPAFIAGLVGLARQTLLADRVICSDIGTRQCSPDRSGCPMKAAA
ncbi:MAG: ferrochelatase, partial [Rhodospirillales bacterium]